MKKFLAVKMSLIMVLSFAACGKKEATNNATEEASTVAAEAGIKGPADLKGKTVGVQTGTTGDLYVSDDAELSCTVERFNKGFEAVQALLQGKVDAVVIDDQPAQVFVSENKGLKILDEEYTAEDYAICISKENDALLEKINKAIKELKDDGTLQSIVDYYIGGKEDAKRYEPSTAEPVNGELIMATNAEFPPYEFHEGDEIVGIDADFAQAIADKLGMKLVIEDMAFDSIIAAVQQGKADMGVEGMTVTEDRLKTINFTDSYYTGRQVIIIKE